LDVAEASKFLFTRKSNNTFGLLELAVRTLHSCGHVVVQLDKEPGFVIVTPSVYSEMEAIAMSARYYIASPLHAANFNSIISVYRRLARRIGVHHDDVRVEHNINASLEFGMIASPIGLTVKSHKPVGEQSLRTIHKGYNTSFAGLTRWVQKILEPKLYAIPWYYKDSFSVREALLEMHVNKSVAVAKIDLKDSFLSGRSHHISIVVAAVFENPVRSLLQEALFLLLEHQYVVSNTLSCTYKCIYGSGIGLLTSASVASLYFLCPC